MRVHVIGAGLAGLAAAVRLARQGIRTHLYEAAPRAGGRCRSFHDPQLGCVIDNGNHLLMSGNSAAMAYLDAIGARSRLDGPAAAEYPFIDIESGTRWSLRPTRGRIPWWVLDPRRRAPGTRAVSYLSALRLLRARPHERVADLIAQGTSLYRNFWEPLTLAALNTAPERAAATLMRSVILETFLKGADACRPLVARDNLADTFVDPALALLEAAGAEIRLGCRVNALTTGDRAVRGLETDHGPVAVAPGERVVVAAPPWIAETLVPGIAAPPAGETIINVHYRMPPPAASHPLRIVGIIGGVAHWVFLRGAIASVTISAAGAMADEDAAAIATKCWHDVALALGEAAMPEPPSRVVKEKRATFAQTPEALARRPGTATAFTNLLLAGDWTDTGLPATIEGAVRSGFRAADAALRAGAGHEDAA